jgi:hypothetical protein
VELQVVDGIATANTVVPKTNQPLERPLTEVTKGNMSVTVDRLIRGEKTRKSQHKGSYGAQEKG